MVECSNCGLMINKNDKKCPRCGHVFDVKKKEKKILTGVGVAAVGAGVIGAGIASHEKENKNAIENLKNNTISKKTEKIEKVETAKKADAKDIVESSSKKQTETQKTAYESKKYNDSLEIDKTKESTTKENVPAEKGQKTTEEDNTQKETDNHEEIAKTDNTDDIEIDENESVSEEIKTLLEKISEEQDNNEEIEALISMLTENQDSDEELEDLLRKLSEGRTDDEALAALIKKLADGQKNIDDQVDNGLEEDMSMSESTSSGGIGGGDSVNISFYQLENALSILGCATSTSLPNSANGENFDITSCKTKGPAGGLANVFTKIDSEEYNKLNNKEGHNQYKKTLSNFDGSETSFLPKMESKLLKLRQNLIDMMGEDYYKLSLGNEILGSCYDENGEIDMDQAKKLENLWNRLHDDDKKDISSMNGTSLKEFIDSFYANDSIQDYFQDFSKELTNYNDMDLVDSDYTQTEIYKRKADKGIILTEEEVREYCERYGDSVAAVLISNISLGRITDDGNKTLTDYVNMNYQDGLYGYDINDNGEEEGKEKASYNQKTQEQETLEQMFWDYLTKTGRNDENKDHYDKMDKYIEDYGNEIGDTSKISTSNQYYRLCQTGFLNSAYTKDGARRYGREYLTEAEFNNDSEVKAKYDSYEKYYEENGGSHYEDPDTNKTVFVPYRNAEEQKNYDRYMDIVKSRGNSSNRFIYGSVFEEVCDAQDEYYEHSLPEYEEIASENLDLIVYDENNNPIGVKNNGDDSTIDDYYERANSAVEKYRESLDRIKLLETFVNQKQITESISSANSENREYSEEDFPPGVKEYLGFLDSKDKRKYMYQYVEKASLPYADTAKAYGNSIGSKVQTTLDMLKEMYGEEEGYIRAEGLKETIINNDNVYRSLIEQNNNVHDQNLGILFNIAQRIATEKREEYDRKNNDNSAVVSAGYWSQNEIDKENELKKEAESAEAEASRLANKMATSKILSNESKSIYEAGLYEIIKSKPVTERTTAENDFFLEYRAKNQVDIKEYNESIDNLYETLSKCNNFKEVCDIINNIGTINIEIENFIGNYKIRSQPDFEEKNKSKIFSLERIEEVDDGGSTTIYINALDENGNKLDVSEEEIEIYLAGIAKENGGKLPLKYRMCYTKSSNQVDRINYLAKTDLEALTYKANTLDYNTFKFDYKSFVEFGALCKATEQYEKYVDILERGNDVEDWFVTVGYGAWAGGAQFVDGFKNLIDPDGLKNENDYRTMLISSYLLNEYGSDSLESNFMLGTYEVTTSIVNMLPTVILSCIPVVGQGLGLATMFLSTAGNATEQGLQSGMTPEQARLYGLINGALETGLQATVGGISKLTIGKLPVAKLITKNLGTILVEGAWYTAATNYLLNILSEGLEEGTQEILDPIIQRLFAASENNFIEMKESLSNLTLTEWQEEKFLEWKSNSLSGIANKEEYLNIYNTKFEDWLATSGIDEAMFDKIKSKEYTYEEWKEDNKLETSASALWGTIDWTAVKKSALYGAISGGIFEGSTQFVPEVISFVRTGTTLGIPAIMNSVRNQAEASGTPKNIFQILAETNQIIKEQSKTGKLGELVSEYMETESFQSDYENFMNEIEQSSKEQTETNATKSKLSNILKSIKETLGYENEMSEVNFATMQVAGSLVANAPLARISNILRDTNYKSYKEYLDRLSELNESETRLTEEIKQLKADNSDINSEINKDNLSKKQKELDEIRSEKNNITEAIEYYKKSTGTLRSDLASEALELLENIRNDEATLNELQQTLAEVENSLNNEIDSTSVKELKNRIKGLKEKLENQRKSKKGITKTAERILLQNIEQYQNALKNLQKNELKGKENKIQQLKESINELTENINSSKARATEIDSILEILLNPESNISSLTSEQFNNFVSELDLKSLQIYSKDIFARLSEMSDVSIENLLSRLDVITLGVFETEIVERIRQIKSNEILNRIKDKYGLRFTKDIYKIETDTTTSDTTTSQTEAIAENTNSDSNTNSNTRNDVQTEVIEENTNNDSNASQNTINNSQTETITRETSKIRKDAPKTEVKKEIISQNGALGVVGIIQMTVIPGLKGNQTLNNVLETIQTDISSLELRRENLNNENSNVDTENNTTEEIESNANIREELESQIEQKKKLYDDLTQLMSKYGVDGSKLLTSLKEEIISGRYKLEHQLLNVKAVIEETTVDSIIESEIAIKELLKKYNLTNADETTLNKVKTEIMYKILEVANKNNISVENILNKINIDEFISKQAPIKVRENLKTSFEERMNSETKVTLAKAINYIGELTIEEVDWLIENREALQLTGESGKFVKTAMQIYQQGLAAAATKYSEFYQNFRDHGFKHALEVTKYAMELAQELNLSEAEIEIVSYAALAHDFGMQGGKVYIDESLLEKFAKSYRKHKGEKESTNEPAYKEMFRKDLLKESRVWDIDGLQTYLKETYGEFISNKDFIMNVARSSHPLNSALDILANSEIVPTELQEKIVKEFGLENAENTAASLIAILAMSHSKSTSGIKLMDQRQMWLSCVEKLKLSAESRGVAGNLNIEVLNKIINDPKLFEKLQDMAVLIRDGDAMSKVVSKDGTLKTIMQNGEEAILGITAVRGENLFNEEGKLIDAKTEQSRIKEVTTRGRIVNDGFSRSIHIGELNTEYSSKYTTENGKKYEATVTVKDSSLAPHSTISQSILERLGELNTYTNMDERTFTIYLSRETDLRIIDLYNEEIETWKSKTLDATKAELEALGIKEGTEEYETIVKKQKKFYENIKIEFKDSTTNVKEITSLECETIIEAIEKLKTSFEERMNSETKVTLAKAINYIGELTIEEVDWLIENREALQLTGESGKFVKTAMQIYQQGLAAAATKYSEFYQNFRDHGFKHALEVTKYAMELAQELNLSEAEIEIVSYAALAHDFGMQGGKVYIDESLLEKFAKSYRKHKGEKESTNEPAYKEMFRKDLLKESRVWDIDGLQTYLKETYGEFISNKDFIMNVARSSHPLNSALDILANSEIVPTELQEKIVKEFGLENAENTAASLIAILAMSHSKSTSGIKLMDQRQMWLSCVEKLKLSAESRGVAGNLNIEVLNKIINDPKLFEKLQDMAVLIRDGDAMSKVVSKDGTLKTIMQNGEEAILGITAVRGENLFNEEGKLIDAKTEQSRIKEVTTRGRIVNDGFSRSIHIGELNTEYSSKYTTENGKKYEATVTVKDSSLAPHSTISQSILERLGELNTYTNMDERTFTIYLSRETDLRIIDLYNEEIETWKSKTLDATKAELEALGIKEGTEEYETIVKKQKKFYENIKIEFKDSTTSETKIIEENSNNRNNSNSSTRNEGQITTNENETIIDSATESATTRIEKALNDVCYNNVNLNTIKNLQEVIEEIPKARRTQVMDAILVKMIKGKALSQETSDAIFKSKMFDGDSNFAKEYLHHVIEVGIPELGIKGSQELANKIRKVYEKARETTKEMPNLHSYCDHTEAHVLQVAFDTVTKGKQIAASKGQTLSETQIKNLFYTGLFHDLGMASGAELGISLETQIVNATKTETTTNSLAEVIKGLNANVIRENHSLNSALQVLRMREELESLGLNADLIAMMCFSHSKSNSGVGNLSSEGDWSYSVSKIRSALEIMNKASGENITLNLENIGGYETLETTNTDSVQKITKDANGNKIKTKLKVSGIPRITFEEGVLNDLEIMSLAIRMGDAYVTKANVKLEEPIRWVGIDGKTYSTDLLVLTQAGVYMAYDATQTAISTKYKQTDDTETSVESAYIYLTKTEDGRYVPWQEGYGVDAEGRYTNVKDSLMYAEDAKIEIKGEKLTLTENGYCYKAEGDDRIYYKLDKNENVEEVETISKEKIQEAEEKYGKTLRTSTGKFLVGESNVSYNVDVRGNVLVSTYKIGDIEIFQSNTISKGILERIGEIATSRNVNHEVNVEFKEEQFMNNFMQIGDKYIGITPAAQKYIKDMKKIKVKYNNIKFTINGILITKFIVN